MSVCMSVYMSVCMSVCMSVYMSVCMSVCMSVYMSVCMSVYMYVCQMLTFEKLDVGSSYLHMRHISMDYGSSSYEDHRVKVEVIGANKVEIPYSHNVKLRSAITAVLSNIEP